jgi:WD40 repeat protein
VLWQTRHSEGLNTRIRTRNDHHNYVVGGDQDFAPIINPNYYLQFTSNGKWLVTSGLDNTVNVVDAASGERRHAPIMHSGFVRNSALSHDGSLLSTVTQDGLAQVWDVETGRPLCQPLKHPLVLTQACFRPDNRLLLTTGRDGLVRVWDWLHERQDCPPLKHGTSVMQAAFLADGRWIMSTGEDQTVRFWSRKTGHPLSPPIRISGVGHQLIVDEEEKTLFVSGTASTVDVVRLGTVLDQGLVSDKHLEMWSEVVSGQRVQNAGIVQLTTQEVLETASHLSRSYPQLISSRSVENESPVGQ